MTKLRLITYSLLLILACGLAITKALDDYGYQYTDQALKRTLIAFGVARGLNGLISVAQEAEIAMQPAGVGLTLSPGEVLDPVNDLIERFSVVMLVSASALGVQKLLLSISAWEYFNIFAILLWLGLAAYLIYNYQKKKKIHSWLIKLGFFLVLIRFATPIMALSNQAIYSAFLQDDYLEASTGLEQVTQTIEQESKTASTNSEHESFIEKAQGWFNNTLSELDVTKQIESYKLAAEQASKDVVRLITIFLVQTILFPLLFLWILLSIGKHFMRSNLDSV